MSEPHFTLTRIRQALELAIDAVDDAAQTRDVAPAAHDPAQQAIACLKRMQARSKLADPPLCEGRWAILLDLYANQGRRSISVSSACIASGHPLTTALRWIGHLVDAGFITKSADRADGRRYNLALTETGEATILAYLNC